jgi:hypothetical protein
VTSRWSGVRVAVAGIVPSVIPPNRHYVAVASPSIVKLCTVGVAERSELCLAPWVRAGAAPSALALEAGGGVTATTCVGRSPEPKCR